MMGQIELYRKGKIPEVILGFIFVTSCLRVLRAIFGSKTNNDLPFKLFEYQEMYTLWVREMQEDKSDGFETQD
jgi:hypothetical protein